MKTALVIGAASGIGQGIADVLSQMGVMTIRADIAFPQQSQDPTVKYVDATDSNSILQLTTYLRNASISLDYLIITTGAIDEGDTTDYPEQNLSWILDINLLVPYRLIQQLLPFLKNIEKAKILLTGSAAGLGAFEATYNLMPYIVSKHALMGYFKALRQDLVQQGIQVSLLLPNRIAGKLSENSASMRKRALNENSEEAKGTQPLNAKLTEPHEIAQQFVQKFLEGKTYISNNPQMIIDKLQTELTEIQQDLFDL